MVDFEDAFSNPAVLIVSIIGEAAFVMMLMILKGMGSSSIMPSWVKIVMFLLIPVISFIWVTYILGD
jgi:hypothetical protein